LSHIWVTMGQEHGFKLPWMACSTMEKVVSTFLVTEKKSHESMCS
jgi:hypothetical protein